MILKRVITGAALLAATLAAVPASEAQSAWRAGLSYHVGAVVTYRGQTSLCVQAHGSQVGWEPPNAPNLWLVQGGTLATPTATATRAPIVLAGAKPRPTATPRTNARAAARIPDPTPTAVARPTGPAAWALHSYYNVGDVVTYGGGRYRCLLLHASIAGWEPPHAPSLWSLDTP